MTREQKLEAALRDMVHAVCGPTGLHEAVKIDTGMSYPWPALDLAEDAAMLALATPPDADTRVVTVDMQRGWLDGFKSALDTAKSITVSVGTVSQSDVVSILQQSFERQKAGVSEEIREIIGMSDLTTNTSAFGLCSDEWQAEMLDYVLSGGLYQRYWQGRWEDVSLGHRHNLHKDRAYRAKPKPVVTVEVTTAFGECVGLDIDGKQDSQIGKITTTFYDGKPKAVWVAR